MSLNDPRHSSPNTYDSYGGRGFVAAQFLRAAKVASLNAAGEIHKAYARLSKYRP